MASVKTGKRNANHMVKNGRYNFYTCSDRILKCDDFSFDDESLLVAGNGNVGNVKYYKGKFDAYQRTYVVTFSKFTGNGYLSLLKNQVNLEQKSAGSVIKFLVIDDIKKLYVSEDEKMNIEILILLKSKQKAEEIIIKTNNIRKKIINLLIK